jgi:3-hydroxyacyl-CoA dehydrogenase
MDTSDASTIAMHKERNGIFDGNESVSLVDLGDGIGCFELHSKANAIDERIVSFLTAELAAGSRATSHFAGFLIATDAKNFSVGANLKELLPLAAALDASGVHRWIRNFQMMTQAIKFCDRPVVSAMHGFCLGGGLEMAMHSAARQTTPELAAGLVEARIGLIPGGGGVKEMLLHAVDASLAGGHDFLTAATLSFTSLALAPRSATAAEARSLQLILPSDGISADRASLLQDAKQCALSSLRNGYTAPPRRAFAVDCAALRRHLEGFLNAQLDAQLGADRMTAHDAAVARQLAFIFTGKPGSSATLVHEDELLARELESFVALALEPLTLARIGHVLATGKPLRN